MSCAVSLGYSKNEAKNDDLSLDLDESGSVHVFKVVLYDGENQVAFASMTKEEMHHSKLLSTSVENDSRADEVPLRVDKAVCLNIYTFEKTISYLKKHRGEEIVIPERPLGFLNLTDIWKDPWDVEFIEKVYSESKSCDRLYELMNTANYLDINPLIHLVGTKLAYIINRTDPSKLHKELGLRA